MMYHKLGFTFLVSIFVLLGGCATGPKFNGLPVLADNESAIVIVRPWALYASGMSGTVYLDEAEIGYMRNGGHIIRKIMPGKHTIAVGATLNLFSGQDKVSMELEAQPGKFSYFGYSIGSKLFMPLSGVATSKQYLGELSKEEANNILDGMR